MKVAFDSKTGLAPTIVQDANTQKILMLGFMNSESLAQTKNTGLVTFYSRSRQALWVKGETSGNYLKVQEILTDCDQDAILIKAAPTGPVCHTGKDTCFGEENATQEGAFVAELQRIIKARKKRPLAGSYTTSLFADGVQRIAQKVGEEAVELILEATGQDADRFTDEAADLLYHFLVLLEAKGISLDAIDTRLRGRHGNKSE